MSISLRPDDSGPGALEPHEELADHLGGEFRETREASRATLVDTEALHYLAHYSSGVFDFSVDTLAEPPRPPDALPGSGRRDELQRLGRQLSFTVQSLDGILQEVRTGGLIRTVLHTENGAVFCDAVVPREHVVGLSLGADVNSADRALARLADRLRELVNLPSLNPGGWKSASIVTPLPSDEPDAKPFVAELVDLDTKAGLVMDECRRWTRPVDLQLAGYCRGNQVVFTVDHFDDDSLAPFFTQITVAARRRFYHSFAPELCSLAARLSRLTSGALGGLLLRMVLDVEQGAIYYYRLGAGEYMIGVTLTQAKVADADERMSRLTANAATLLPG
ncbi:MAG TPA: hypothetical protein VGX25_30245 [Actinophytocola sp.]|uniref:hypothetical protein n=1 Tax=Actinophytocola sp. TaxID=1872138 RepID=UPI002DDD85C5|nr:hypothetical protein [Actinophytocola sp.]HEV2783689.1 hypothetical protein [Actinophytocola sp.]